MSGFSVELLQHAGREIQAEDGFSRVAQVASDMTGSTAHITNFARPSLQQQAIEQFAIHGLCWSSPAIRRAYSSASDRSHGESMGARYRAYVVGRALHKHS